MHEPNRKIGALVRKVGCKIAIDHRFFTDFEDMGDQCSEENQSTQGRKSIIPPSCIGMYQHQHSCVLVLKELFGGGVDGIGLDRHCEIDKIVSLVVLTSVF